MDSVIEDVQVRKILDSRGNPTVEVDVTTWNGFGRAAAPSGASTGSREVVSFPEGGVDVIVREVEDFIASELIGMDANDITTIDEVLREVDGTENLSAIGGNTTVAVSMAVAKAAAASSNMPLYKYLGGNWVNEIPFPLGNMMNGGAHAGINAPDIQEFLVVPVGAKNIVDAIFANASVHKKLKGLIQSKDSDFTGGKGDEGGWVPNITNDNALEILAKACEEAGADSVSTALNGYTPDTLQYQDGPNYDLLKECVNGLAISVFAEGRYNTPAEAGKAMEFGAFAVVSGTAITRPRVITQWFVQEINRVSLT